MGCRPSVNTERVPPSIVSKVGDGPEQTFHAGDAWWEPLSAIHRVSRNASFTEAVTLLAIYVAPRSAAAADLMKPIWAGSVALPSNPS